mgnify:CR=1 FL=1
MTYTNYEYYTDTYGGKLISESDFPRLESIAAAYIDALTFGRTASVEDESVLELVKMAVCTAADILWRREQGGRIASERVGDYSVSYEVDGEPEVNQIYRVAKVYLGDLMYRGFYDGEYGSYIK